MPAGFIGLCIPDYSPIRVRTVLCFQCRERLLCNILSWATEIISGLSYVSGRLLLLLHDFRRWRDRGPHGSFGQVLVFVEHRHAFGLRQHRPPSAGLITHRLNRLQFAESSGKERWWFLILFPELGLDPADYRAASKGKLFLGLDLFFHINGINLKIV